MSADVIMPPNGYDEYAPRTGGGWRKLRSAHRRLDAGVVFLIGFAAGMGWAFVGSLVFGLGTEAVSKLVARLWLAGEALIGVAVFAALLLGAPPSHGDGV